MPATVARSSSSQPPEMPELVAAMRAEGLAPYRWDNNPGFVYAPHTHAYHKVLYCLRGSIRFTLTRESQTVELRAGDRLDLPPQTEHSAVVGAEGVACLEAQRD